MSILPKLASVGLLSLAALAASIAAGSGPTPSIVFPELSGPHRVGRKIFDWTDSSRADPFDKRVRRELMVWVWYPAAEPGKPAEYVPGAWGRSAARMEALDLRIRSGSLLTGLFSAPLSSAALRRIQIHATADAAPERGHFPVLLFSPGLGNMPSSYTAVLEDIASHGYVIVAVNPTRFTWSTVFADGRSTGMMPLWERGGQKLEQQFTIWVNDLSFAMRQIGDNLGSLADMDRVGFLGHSYGGAAALATCARESACIAAADWDGSPRGADRTGAIGKPVLMLQSDHGEVDHDRDSLRYFEGLATGYRLVLKGLKHRGFTDEAVLPLPSGMRRELAGELSPAEAISRISTLTRAFFDTHLSAMPSPLLCHPAPGEVILYRKGRVCGP